jgi:hypothetical protein
MENDLRRWMRLVEQKLREDLCLILPNPYDKDGPRIQVYRNPTSGEMRDAFREAQFHALRGILDLATATVYVWDAAFEHSGIEAKLDTAAGYDGLLLWLKKDHVRIQWSHWNDFDTKEEAEADLAEMITKVSARCDNLWRAYGRRVPLLPEEDENDEARPWS